MLKIKNGFLILTAQKNSKQPHHILVRASALLLVGMLLCAFFAFAPQSAHAGPELPTKKNTLKPPSSLKATTTPDTPILSGAGKSDMVMANGLRFGLYKDYTRVVIDLSEQPGYRVFMLENPDRIVLDLDHVFWEGVPQKGQGSGIVRSYSRQSVNDERTRLVLETGGAVKVVNIFGIPARDQRSPRLVIDLDRATAQSRPNNGLIADTIKPPVQTPPKPSYSTQTTQTTVATLDAPFSAALVAPTIPRPTIKPKAWRVVLDAGHGGNDPGAIGVNHVQEKQLTLAVALKIKAALEARGRYDVRLTRSNDRFIPLRQRVDIARDHEAEFFISLHADSHPDPDVRGASIYTLSEKASDKEAERLAGQENRVDAIGGINLSNENPDVANILIDLAMRETMNQSKKAASLLVDSFDQQSIRLVRNGHRSAGFVVLKAADVPSLLIEMGYLSNAKDAAALGDNDYIERLVIAISNGIDGYFKGQHPTQQAANPAFAE